MDNTCFFLSCTKFCRCTEIKTNQAPKKTSIKIDNDISENHPPINSPIANELKKIDFAEITDDYILIPNSATELDEDGTIPTIEAAYSYVINVIDKDVIGARFLGEELNSPLKKKHYLDVMHSTICKASNNIIKKKFFSFLPSHPHKCGSNALFIGVSVVRVGVFYPHTTLTPSFPCRNAQLIGGQG